MPVRRLFLAETVPLLTDDLRFNKIITNLGLGIRTTSTDDSMIVVYKNEEGSTIFTDTLSDMTKRYTILGSRGNALFWKLNFKNTGNDSWSNTILDRFDIYYNETVKDKVE